MKLEVKIANGVVRSLQGFKREKDIVLKVKEFVDLKKSK
jgi:hypothetical protein